MIRVAVAMFMLALVASCSSTPAFARHHHRHHRTHHRHHAVETAPAQPPILSRVFGGGSSLIDAMRAHLGGNPTGWAHVWCGRFLSMMLRATGHAPGSDAADAYRHYGTPADGPCVGCLAVWLHHVGVVTGIPGPGRIILLSGNDGHRVRERERPTRGAVFRRVSS